MKRNQNQKPFNNEKEKAQKTQSNKDKHQQEQIRKSQLIQRINMLQSPTHMNQQSPQKPEQKEKKLHSTGQPKVTVKNSNMTDKASSNIKPKVINTDDSSQKRELQFQHSVKSSQNFSENGLYYLDQTNNKSQISERLAPQIQGTFKSKIGAPLQQDFYLNATNQAIYDLLSLKQQPVKNTRNPQLIINRERTFQTLIDLQGNPKSKPTETHQDLNGSSIFCKTIEAQASLRPVENEATQIIDSNSKQQQQRLGKTPSNQVNLNDEKFTPQKLLNLEEQNLQFSIQKPQNQVQDLTDDDSILFRHQTLTKKFNSSVDFRKRQEIERVYLSNLDEGKFQQIYEDGRHVLSDDSWSSQRLNEASRETNQNDGPHMTNLKVKERFRSKDQKQIAQPHDDASDQPADQFEFKHQKIRSEIIQHYNSSSKQNSKLKKRQSRRYSQGKSECSSIMNESNHILEVKKQRSNKKYQFLNNYELLKEMRVNMDSLPSQQTQTLSSPQSTRINSIVELNLRLQNLTELSEALFIQNIFIRSVDVRNNRLLKIPDTICDLPYLWKIRLDYNYVTELPQSLGSITKLEYLSASQNKLQQLPKSLVSSKQSLGVLIVNDNKIKSLDDKFGNLAALRQLHLHHNPIAALPSSFFKLRNLTELGLDWFLYHFKDRQISKVQKDDSGRILIQEFLRFMSHFEKSCDHRQELQVSFVHYFMFFHKLQKTSEIQDVLYAKKRTIFHILALNGSLHLFLELHDLLKSVCKADLNNTDEDESTALQLAIKNKRKEFIKHLLALPSVNINKGNSKYSCPLHLLIQTHSFKLALNLVLQDKSDHYKYVDVNAKNEDGNNAMHLLLMNFSLNPQAAKKLAAQLIKRGISLNSFNRSELSPLHLAILGNQLEGVQFALNHNELMRRTSFLQVVPLNPGVLLLPSAISPLSSLSLKADQQQLEGQLPTRKGLSFSRQMFDFNLKGGKFGQNSLQLAIVQNNLRMISTILSSQEDINHLHIDDEGRMARDICPYNSPFYKLILQFEQRQVLKYSQREEPMSSDRKKVDAEGGRMPARLECSQPPHDIQQYHYNFRTQKQPRSFQRRLMHQKSTPNFYGKQQKGGSLMGTRNQSVGAIIHAKQQQQSHTQISAYNSKNIYYEDNNFLSARVDKEVANEYSALKSQIPRAQTQNQGGTTLGDYLGIYLSNQKNTVTSLNGEDSSDQDHLDEISNQDFQTQQKHRPSTTQHRDKLKRSILNYHKSHNPSLNQQKFSNHYFKAGGLAQDQNERTQLEQQKLFSSPRKFKEDRAGVSGQSSVEHSEIQVFKHTRMSSTNQHLTIKLKGNVSSPDDSMFSPQHSTMKSMSRLSNKPKASSHGKHLSQNQFSIPEQMNTERLEPLIENLNSDEIGEIIFKTAQSTFQNFEDKTLKFKHYQEQEEARGVQKLGIFARFQEENFLNTSHRALFQARQSMMNSGSFAPRIEEYQVLSAQQKSSFIMSECLGEQQVKSAADQNKASDAEINSKRRKQTTESEEEEKALPFKSPMTLSEKSVEVELVSRFEALKGESCLASDGDDAANISDEEDRKQDKNSVDPKTVIKVLTINQTVTGQEFEEEGNSYKQQAYVKKIIEEVKRCKLIQTQAEQIIKKSEMSRNYTLNCDHSMPSQTHQAPSKNFEEVKQGLGSQRLSLVEENPQEQGDANLDQSSMFIADDCGSLPTAPMEEQFSPKIASAQKEFTSFKSKLAVEICQGSIILKSTNAQQLQPQRTIVSAETAELQFLILAILRNDQRVKRLLTQNFSNLSFITNHLETLRYLDVLYMTCNAFGKEDLIDLAQQIFAASISFKENRESQSKQVTSKIFEIALFEIINAHQIKIFDEKKSLQHQIILLDRQKLLSEVDEYANKKLNIKKVKSILKSPSLQNLQIMHAQQSSLQKLYGDIEHFPQSSPVRKLRMKDYNSNSNTVISQLVSPSDQNSEVYNSIIDQQQQHSYIFIATVLVNRRMLNTQEPSSTKVNAVSSHFQSLSNTNNNVTLHQPYLSSSIKSSSRQLLQSLRKQNSTYRQPPLTQLNQLKTARDQFKFSTEIERLSLEETIVSEILPEITPSGAKSIVTRINFDSEGNLSTSRAHKKESSLLKSSKNYIRTYQQEIKNAMQESKKTLLYEYGQTIGEEEAEEEIRIPNKLYYNDKEDEIRRPNKLHSDKDEVNRVLKSGFELQSNQVYYQQNPAKDQQSILLANVQKRQNQLKEKLFQKTHNIQSTIHKYNLSKHLNDLNLIKANIDSTPTSRNNKGNSMMFGQLLQEKQASGQQLNSSRKNNESNQSSQVQEAKQMDGRRAQANKLTLASIKENNGFIKMSQRNLMEPDESMKRQLVADESYLQEQRTKNRSQYLLHHFPNYAPLGSLSSPNAIQILDQDRDSSYHNQNSDDLLVQTHISEFNPRKGSSGDDYQNMQITRNAQDILKSQSLSLKMSPIVSQKRIASRTKVIHEQRGLSQEQSPYEVNPFSKTIVSIPATRKNLQTELKVPEVLKNRMLTSRSTAKISSFQLSSSQRSILLNQGAKHTQTNPKPNKSLPFASNQHTVTRLRQLQNSQTQKSLRPNNIHTYQNSQAFSMNLLNKHLYQIGYEQVPATQIYSALPFSAQLQSVVNTPLETNYKNEINSNKIFSDNSSENLSLLGRNIDLQNHLETVDPLRLDTLRHKAHVSIEELKSNVGGPSSSLNFAQRNLHQQHREIILKKSKLKKQNLQAQEQSFAKKLHKDYSTQSIQSFSNHGLSQTNLNEQQNKDRPVKIPNTLSSKVDKVWNDKGKNSISTNGKGNAQKYLTQTHKNSQSQIVVLTNGNAHQRQVDDNVAARVQEKHKIDKNNKNEKLGKLQSQRANKLQQDQGRVSSQISRAQDSARNQGLLYSKSTAYLPQQMIKEQQNQASELEKKYFINRSRQSPYKQQKFTNQILSSSEKGEIQQFQSPQLNPSKQLQYAAPLPPTFLEISSFKSQPSRQVNHTKTQPSKQTHVASYSLHEQQDDELNYLKIRQQQFRSVYKNEASDSTPQCQAYIASPLNQLKEANTLILAQGKTISQQQSRNGATVKAQTNQIQQVQRKSNIANQLPSSNNQTQSQFSRKQSNLI